MKHFARILWLLLLILVLIGVIFLLGQPSGGTAKDRISPESTVTYTTSDYVQPTNEPTPEPTPTEIPIPSPTEAVETPALDNSSSGESTEIR